MTELTDTQTPEIQSPLLTSEPTEKKGKIITCIPLVVGNGSKHTAANLAHNYHILYPNQKVALVDFDFHHPTLLANQTSYDTVHGLDNLLDQIDGRQLTATLFKENMLKLKNGIHLLKGTQLRQKQNIIQRHHIEEILHYLREHYDAIFVAISNVADNAGTVYTLMETDDVLLVAFNNYTNLTQGDEVVKLVRRYFKESIRLKIVFNRFNLKSQTDFNQWFQDNSLDVIGSVPFNDKAIDGADLFALTLPKFSFQKGPKVNLFYEPILYNFFPRPEVKKK